MSRHQFGANQQADPSQREQARAIGLRAVAAAVRYQGDSHNVEPWPSREPPVPTASATQPDDHEP